jgi:UDP-N-acetylglucosamine enolpyruvyl transferase
LTNRLLRSTPRLCVLLFGGMAIVSCSASFHLNRAIKKGAKVKTDTTYVDVITDRTVTDTVALLSEVTKNDTIIVNTTRWLSKLYIKNDTIWQKVECKPDTVKVPITVTQTITAPPKVNWWKYLLAGFCLGLILMCFVRR